MADDDKKTPENQNERTTKNAEPTQHYDEPTKKALERDKTPAPMQGTPNPVKTGPIPGDEPKGPKPVDWDDLSPISPVRRGV